ncbi:MAG: HEPN domain-containing protein [Candidatus Nezhaarchaeales archaeon]
MSFEEIEVLKRRAEAFLRNADHLLKNGEWDLAVFNLEQYCQLVLKYKLLVKTGSYPRTHSLRRLIREPTKYYSKLQHLIEDEQTLRYVARLEEAYVASRHIPYSYEEKEVQSLHRFIVDRFKRLVDEV